MYIHCRSTSNETLSGGTNIPAALKEAWPQLTETDLQEFITQYPLTEFSSASQQFQVATGESALICAVSINPRKNPPHLDLTWTWTQREIMGNAFAKKTKAFTYRYNQPNPTFGSSAVGHAAENFMMFRGINTGYMTLLCFLSTSQLTLRVPFQIQRNWDIHAFDPHRNDIRRRAHCVLALFRTVGGPEYLQAPHVAQLAGL